MTTTSDTRQCYFPKGNKAPNNVPCKSDTNTHCCGKTDICLDNGLCLNTGHQPYVLSRGSCTNEKWNGCSPICKNATPSKGASIINLGFSSGSATYCCGSPVTNGSNVVCPSDESDNGSNVPFTIQDGVPLGAIAVLLFIWALLERRRANRAMQPMHTVAMNGGSGAFEHAGAGPYMNITDTSGPPPVELDYSQPLPELMGGNKR
ncbi:uncharacterized protein BDW43DRAFT_313493 [Aspergillus alliaceus]|uniref:uncharacterized protein n=1 Tax=Petromyces alliaceus TaxID=209559 RepID=UPI0012A5B798|nr:uncharacterized protein BDW43DRAFT_313493 [Aspergillus alliaceus]KAB8230923.1 hypothetical protein BDW43DRAFT_313493 [Aspergillus alliaceus]